MWKSFCCYFHATNNTEKLDATGAKCIRLLQVTLHCPRQRYKHQGNSVKVIAFPNFTFLRCSGLFSVTLRSPVSEMKEQIRAFRWNLE